MLRLRSHGVLLVCMFVVAAPVAVAPPDVAAQGCASRLRPLVKRILAERGVPGALIDIDIPGVCRWKAAIGTGRAEGGKHIKFSDHMRIGSITKTITGTAVLQLVDEGFIGLDDPISDHLDGVPNGQNITIRQIMQMRSGLHTYSNDPAFNLSLDQHPERNWTVAELLAIAFSYDRDFDPGTDYTYSNTNTLLLGLLVEKYRGLPLDQALRKRIFKPLGMSETSLATSSQMPAPFAHGYAWGTNYGTLDGKCDADTVGRLDVTFASPSWTWAAGGAISTLRDLKIWARAMGTGALLTSETQAERLEFLPIRPGSPLGYGLQIANFRGGVIGHNGALPGYQSFVGYVPSRDGTIVILTNTYPDKMCGTPADEIFIQIAQELGLF